MKMQISRSMMNVIKGSRNTLINFFENPDVDWDQVNLSDSFVGETKRIVVCSGRVILKETSYLLKIFVSVANKDGVWDVIDSEIDFCHRSN
ncbi:hypothetical protein KKG48_03460 [Patescibacteria group bacterium]|nr:hypothetical protein [Patescibacteria group bacterium]MCG2694613.1 hypothetical protein [Candidatus Parcubacteria bacterium]